MSNQGRNCPSSSDPRNLDRDYDSRHSNHYDSRRCDYNYDSGDYDSGRSDRDSNYHSSSNHRDSGNRFHSDRSQKHRDYFCESSSKKETYDAERDRDYKSERSHRPDHRDYHRSDKRDHRERERDRRCDRYDSRDNERKDRSIDRNRRSDRDREHDRDRERDRGYERDRDRRRSPSPQKVSKRVEYKGMASIIPTPTFEQHPLNDEQRTLLNDLIYTIYLSLYQFVSEFNNATLILPQQHHAQLLKTPYIPAYLTPAALTFKFFEMGLGAFLENPKSIPKLFKIQKKLGGFTPMELFSIVLTQKQILNNINTSITLFHQYIIKPLSTALSTEPTNKISSLSTPLLLNNRLNPSIPDFTILLTLYTQNTLYNGDNTDLSNNTSYSTTIRTVADQMTLHYKQILHLLQCVPLTTSIPSTENNTQDTITFYRKTSFTINITRFLPDIVKKIIPFYTTVMVQNLAFIVTLSRLLIFNLKTGIHKMITNKFNICHIAKVLIHSFHGNMEKNVLADDKKLYHIHALGNISNIVGVFHDMVNCIETYEKTNYTENDNDDDKMMKSGHEDDDDDDDDCFGPILAHKQTDEQRISHQQRLELVRQQEALKANNAVTLGQFNTTDSSIFERLLGANSAETDFTAPLRRKGFNTADDKETAARQQLLDKEKGFVRVDYFPFPLDFTTMLTAVPSVLSSSNIIYKPYIDMFVQFDKSHISPSALQIDKIDELTVITTSFQPIECNFTDYLTKGEWSPQHQHTLTPSSTANSLHIIEMIHFPPDLGHIVCNYLSSGISQWLNEHFNSTSKQLINLPPLHALITNLFTSSFAGLLINQNNTHPSTIPQNILNYNSYLHIVTNQIDNYIFHQDPHHCHPPPPSASSAAELYDVATHYRKQTSSLATHCRRSFMVFNMPLLLTVIDSSSIINEIAQNCAMHTAQYVLYQNNITNSEKLDEGTVFLSSLSMELTNGALFSFPLVTSLNILLTEVEKNEFEYAMRYRVAIDKSHLIKEDIRKNGGQDSNTQKKQTSLAQSFAGDAAFKINISSMEMIYLQYIQRLKLKDLVKNDPDNKLLQLQMQSTSKHSRSSDLQDVERPRGPVEPQIVTYGSKGRMINVARTDGDKVDFHKEFEHISGSMGKLGQSSGPSRTQQLQTQNSEFLSKFTRGAYEKPQ